MFAIIVLFKIIALFNASSASNPNADPTDYTDDLSTSDAGNPPTPVGSADWAHASEEAKVFRGPRGIPIEARRRVNESFADGICREVLEETGVQTKFVSLLTFWHRHGVSTNFAAADGGKSDMYFCARLEPVTDEIRLQEDEISACEWQDLRAFCRENDHPLISAVARRLYGVGGDDDVAPLRPVRELVETDEVRWPSRPAAYPAYFPF